MRDARKAITFSSMKMITNAVGTREQQDRGPGEEEADDVDVRRDEVRDDPDEPRDQADLPADQEHDRQDDAQGSAAGR